MRGAIAELVLPLALLACSATPLASQQTPGRAMASLEAGLRGSTLRGSAEALWGGAGLLHLDSRVSVGGAGWLLAGRSEIVEATPGSDVELTFGYAGAVADVILHDSQGSHVSFRALVGAGNARVLRPVVGSEVGSDNFGVVEPELTGARRFGVVLSLRLGVSYRFVYSVEDLAQVVASDLRGASISLSLGIDHR